MAYFLVAVILALFSSHHSVGATRFLPTIVWDHLNPLLSCKCNWLIIPYVDGYDEQQFTCPTSKISSNILDGYLRPDSERNENIFRRKWPGTRNDLIKKIRDGSIDSFCDPESRDTTKIYQCKNGKYSSTEVTYKYNSIPEKMYEKDNIYIFFNNGDDGKEATLDSKRAKCTMFFAVHVTQDNKKAIYGMDFDKAALTTTKCCKSSSCPLSSITPSQFNSSATISSRPSTVTRTITTITTSIIVTTTVVPSKKTELQHAKISPTSIRTMKSKSAAKPVTRQPNSSVPCADNCVNVTILVVAIIGSFIFGMFISTVLFLIMKRRQSKRDRYQSNEEACNSPGCSPKQTEVHQVQNMKGGNQSRKL